MGFQFGTYFDDLEWLWTTVHYVGFSEACCARIEVAKSDKKIDLEFSDVQIIHTFAGRVIASHSACKFPADSMGDDDDDDDGSICLHSLLLFYTVSQQAPQKAR